MGSVIDRFVSQAGLTNLGLIFLAMGVIFWVAIGSGPKVWMTLLLMGGILTVVGTLRWFVSKRKR